MENLKLIGFREVSDPSLSSGLSCFTIDSFHSTIYAINKLNQLVSIDQKSKLVKTLSSIDNERVVDSHALHIELFVENNELNLYFENGNICTYSLESSEINCVGFVQEGIAAVSSSPDQEYIALISKEDKLFLFTRFFDVLVEKDLHADHSECIQKVDVGWGSKKTQFHGSEGKEAAKITGEPLEPPVTWDDQKRRVCWRGDGLYFVTSAIHPEKNHRVLRVWNNEGLLQYESEYVAGLEHSLAWRPEGNLIASSRFHQDVHEIVFFEKNGLRHGQFTLPVPYTSLVIKNLIWSTDSTILLVHGCEEKQHIIYLYTMRNYHYYLKQCYKFKDDVELIAWDPYSQLTFSIFTSKGYVKQYSYNWTTDQNDGTAAVIDGCRVHVTPFNRVSIPPPMSAYSIIYESPINELHVYSPEILLAYTCDGEIIVCELKSGGKSEIKIETNVRNTAIGSISGKILFSMSDLPGLQHLRLITKLKKQDHIIAVRKSIKDELLEISLSTKEVNKLTDLDQEILILDYPAKMQILAFQLMDRSVKKLDIVSKELSNWIELPGKLIDMKIIEVMHKLHIIGLSREGTLYFDEKPFIKNSCSSFLIHQDEFLISTANDNLLRCNRLDEYFIQVVLPSCLDPRDEPRNIERRSKLVISIKDDARVILQMPRGNIESIHPRTILLERLKTLSNQDEFDVAFNIMKRHRINLNLLADYNILAFFGRCEKVIEQLGKDVQDICLFLSELSNENVCKTMYKFAFSEEQIDHPSKVNYICSKLRDFMTAMDEKRYLIPILLTYVKVDPPQIGDALRMVYYKTTGEERDECLRYLNYLIDIEKLYKEALGTYDFDIFLMVAQKSTKDPKEYHTYLDNLRSYENIHYRHFKIDVDLKRYQEALFNMGELTDEIYRDECLNFIKSNRLFWLAVKFISSDHPWIQNIWEMFGDYLLIKRYYEVAGLAYKKAKSITNAIKAFQLSENWQTAIDLAMSLDDYDYISLCKSFVTRLAGNNKAKDAAYIQEVYLKDKKGAISTLIAGHHWAEANRLLEKDPSDDLNDELITQLIQAATNFEDLLVVKRNDLEAKIKRLKIVEGAKLKSYEDESEQVEEDNDIFSDTSSMSNSSSTSSGSRHTKTKGDLASLVTRRTRLKKQLTKYSLKEGSANEDISLRKLIKEIIESYVALEEEARSLIRWLIFYDLCREASDCQNELVSLMKYIETQVKIVWPDPEDAIQSLDQTGVNKAKIVQSLAARCFKDPEAFVPPKFMPKPWKSAFIMD